MKVLICLDYSSASDLILNESKKFLRPFPTSSINVHTVQDVVVLSNDQFGGSVMYNLETEVEELKKKAIAAFGKRKIKFSSSSGIPVDNILAETKNSECDLLIMGTHGRTGFTHMLLGSVAEKVLRHIECNVLVIPIKKKK